MLGNIEGKEKGATEAKMVEWHHRLNGYEFEQTPKDSEGQGSLACCSSWGRKEQDTTWRLNNTHTKCCLWSVAQAAVFGEHGETLLQSVIVVKTTKISINIYYGSILQEKQIGN